MRPTFHLVPAAVWDATDPAAPYRAASLADEGFIHCTDGADELIATANRHYRDDPRPFVVLTLDLDAVGSPWSVEDARGIYPHVFGPIDTGAVLATVPLRRSADGTFLGFGETRPAVVAVNRSPTHTFSKPSQSEITLRAGHGVEGDAHAGATVKHRSRVARDPNEPNRRQVHLVHRELHDELRAGGFHVGAGDMGENVTTEGVDLLDLPVGTRLQLGRSAVIELTGLRTPCSQLDDFEAGLMAACLDRADDGSLIRKSGVMAVVLADGVVRPGDPIEVIPPEGEPQPLQPI